MTMLMKVANRGNYWLLRLINSACRPNQASLSAGVLPAGQIDDNSSNQLSACVVCDE